MTVVQDAVIRRALAVPWRVVGLVAAGYFAGSMFSFLVLDAPTALAVLFPPAGVTVAALLLTRRNCWAWILGAAALTEAVSDLGHGMSPASAVGFALANSVEPLVSALLLGQVPFTRDLSKRTDMGWFVGLAVVAGPMVGGLIGATTITLTMGGPWLQAFPAFWSGDALGVLTVGGTILAVARSRWRRTDALRFVLVAVATAVVTVVGFLPADLPLIYLPIPLLLLMAWRYDVAYVLGAGMVMTLTANTVSSLGYGPWGDLVRVPTASIATLQLFLVVTILAAWLLSVAVAERERASRRYLHEHESALQLQRALLPQVPDALPGVRLAAEYRPADIEQEIGGDWYGKVAIVVGDIVGHRLDAAVAMGRLHAALRVIIARQPQGPKAVLEALDEATTLIPEAWCSTVGYAEYDPVEGTLRYACAGHPPPLLVTSNRVRYLHGGRSTPLGVTDLPRTEAVQKVPPGAVLIWYSDGLIERRAHGLDKGMRQLAHVVADLDLTASPQEWCRRILTALTTERMEDDIVLICVTLTPGKAEHRKVATLEAQRRPTYER